MRPKIDGMLDCTIEVWRPVIETDAIGVEERPSHTLIATVDAFINRPREPMVPAGGGLAPTGAVRWYGRPTINVLVRDICRVASGPETGKMFEVNEPPVRPKNHHTQVDCIEWNGVLGAAPIFDPAPFGSPVRLYVPESTTSIREFISQFDFDIQEPEAGTISFSSDEGPLIGFNVGTAFQGRTHARSPLPALDQFSLHVILKGTRWGQQIVPLTFYQDNIDQGGVFPDDFQYQIARFDASPIFGSYTMQLTLEDSDRVDGDITNVGYQHYDPIPGDPAAEDVFDVLYSMDADGLFTIKVNGVGLSNDAGNFLPPNLWSPAGLNSIIIGGGFMDPSMGRSYTGEFYIGAIVLYENAIDDAQMNANRTAFQAMGYPIP